VWNVSCNSNQTATEMIGHLDLSDKTILITGADGNIASEVNLSLAKQGAQLIFGCYSVDKCATTKDMIVK
jgi:NAD(P)-dependent dehydrogenase (short-subunit alcohol dehydrogenase family)